MAAIRTYPSDVQEEEWAFVAPYLALMREEVPQRQYPLRALFNALRYLAHTGCPWRYLPHDLPPWQAVYQQWRRWRDARVFESIVHDVNELQRVLLGRTATPTAIVLDGRTLQSTPESGHRAGYDGAKKRKGSKAHIAVDTLGQLLSVVITPANEQERAQVGELCRQVQQVTGQTVQVGFVDQGYTGPEPEEAAAMHNIDLQVVKKPEGQTGFGFLPRRWVVERSFAWLSRFRRLGRDYERLSSTLQQLHFVVFACLMLARNAASA
ncbi:IS5 family transposase [Hymenobacter sp. BT664]|uniref:IS5 family transposase n=1 Tax=Hymenobacter montanus TaxID=2771359 RepID=A0A927BGD4_9BACT|nr:IS5 family transposase [Hymenobacter montanus]MBD2770390.1 IS5 family transposase [Hymenobacter montanus]